MQFNKNLQNICHSSKRKRKNSLLFTDDVEIFIRRWVNIALKRVDYSLKLRNCFKRLLTYILKK